jgi:hypothetical protein
VREGEGGSVVDDDDPLLVCLGWAFRSVERVTLRIAVQLMGALIEYSTSGRQTDHLTLVICGRDRPIGFHRMRMLPLSSSHFRFGLVNWSSGFPPRGG